MVNGFLSYARDQMRSCHVKEGRMGKTTYFASILHLSGRLALVRDINLGSLDLWLGREALRFKGKLRLNKGGTGISLCRVAIKNYV